MENIQKKLLFNYFLYFFTFILLCFYGVIHASALTYTNIGYQNNITVVLVAPDYSNTPINVPINSSYAFNEVRQVIIQVDNYNFTANKNYQLEMYIPQQDLGRANVYSVQGYNGENCLISYENSAFNGQYPRFAFQCSNPTTTITITISNSNNSYLWDNGPNGAPVFTWGYSYLKYSDTSLNNSGLDSDNIINNNNQNTQNIINNNNQNTQNIIDSQTVCNTTNINKDNIKDDNKILKSDNTLSDATGWGVTDYIDIENATYLKVIDTYTYTTQASICYYNSQKNLISCQSIGNLSGDLTIPNNTKYFRTSIIKSTDRPKYEFKICKNGNQAVTDSVNDLNDTLNDDDTSGAESEASEFFSSFNTNTFGLTSIITAPLNLINSLLNAGAICNELQLPLPYLNNKYLTLPCMYPIYRQTFGVLFTLYQTITYGIVAYWVCVRIFNQVKDFKNPEHDEIEVLDL